MPKYKNLIDVIIQGTMTTSPNKIVTSE